MKKLYTLLLLLISFSFYGQTIYSESFETDTNGSNYTTSIDEFTDGAGDFFLRTNGDDIGSFYEVSGVDGDFFFGASDIDGEGATLPVSLSTAAIDVSGRTDVDFVILLGEDDDGTNQDWDGADYLHIFYSLDGGAEQNLLWVEAEIDDTNEIPRIDTDFDGIGDGEEITDVMKEFVRNVTLNGASSITFRLEFSLNSGDEDIAVDNIRVVQDYVAPANITITSPTDGTVFEPGTTSVDLEFTASNTSSGDQVDVTVNGTTSTDVSSPFAISTTDGESYDVTVAIVNGSNTIDSEMISFSVGQSTSVVDITALRADVETNGEGGFYQITGPVVVTFTNDFRNRKWVQDTDTDIAGILIYDEAGVITTDYVEGDVVSGLRGRTEISNGILRFIPTSDSGTIVSSGTMVTPQTVTIAQLNASIDDYESELIELENVSFVDGDGTTVFETGTNYDVTNGTETIVKRTDFFDADYIDELIPTGTISSLVALAGEFNGTAQIYVRELSDLTLSLDRLVLNEFKIYPNPTSTGSISIQSSFSGDIDVEVFDVLGKKVMSQKLTNNNLNVSALNNGVYIVKLKFEESTVTKKLVIR